MQINEIPPLFSKQEKNTNKTHIREGYACSFPALKTFLIQPQTFPDYFHWSFAKILDVELPELVEMGKKTQPGQACVKLLSVVHKLKKMRTQHWMYCMELQSY